MNGKQIYFTVLKYLGILAAALLVVGGGLGYLFAGPDGLISAILGTVVAVLFSAITVISIIVAIRFEVAGFFAIIMGAWLVKFVLFIVALLALREQEFISPLVLFLSLVVGITATIAIDCLVVYRARMPYVSDVRLPGDPEAP